MSVRTFVFRLPVVAALAVIVAMTPAIAQKAPPAEPLPQISTDRPSVGAGPYVVPQNTFQLEMGFVGSRLDQPGPDQDELSVLSVVGRLGILHDDLELRYTWGGWGHVTTETATGDETVSGTNDFALGAKWRFHEATGKGPTIALLGNLSIPSDHREFSTRAYDPGVDLLFGHVLGRFYAQYNAGVGWETADSDSGDRTTRSRFRYSVAGAYAVTGKVGVFLELFGDTALSSVERGPATGADGGVVWVLRNNLQVDARVGVASLDETTTRFGEVGVSWRLPR